ncbi:MAG: ornithine cyclodeaminase family protein, partial [Alphaproteobacteria bacterium]
IGDQFLRGANGTFVSRSAWIEDFGIGVKSVTVMPKNASRQLPTVQGGMLFFDDDTGQPVALIDSDVVTWWKTAGDSVLGALLLAAPDPQRLLIIGAGTVAESLIEAYGAVFPSLKQIVIWNRTPERAGALADKASRSGWPVSVTDDLPAAVGEADIICAATMASDPVLMGDWVRPGSHVDLIGAYRADMREADDALLQKARLFVDCRDTTIDRIGELMIPLASGAIKRDHILGDLYDLVAGAPGRTGSDDITVFKNGGGAHLDLMTARYILDACEQDTQ